MLLASDTSSLAMIPILTRTSRLLIVVKLLPTQAIGADNDEDCGYDNEQNCEDALRFEGCLPQALLANALCLCSCVVWIVHYFGELGRLIVVDVVVVTFNVQLQLVATGHFLLSLSRNRLHTGVALKMTVLTLTLFVFVANVAVYLAPLTHVPGAAVAKGTARLLTVSVHLAARHAMPEVRALVSVAANAVALVPVHAVVIDDLRAF